MAAACEGSGEASALTAPVALPVARSSACFRDPRAGDGQGDRGPAGRPPARPDELVEVRTAESFRVRAAQRVSDTLVAVVDDTVAGFVMVVDDEVEQVYVARGHRGTRVSGVLLAAAERVIAMNGHGRAWLAVVAGNARARRFYERHGWIDDGLVDYPAATAGGAILVQARRYTKRVAGRADGDPPNRAP